MSDYIKREDAIRQIVKTSAQNELDIPAIGTVIYILSEMDSADVRENVRGEWIFPYEDKKYKRCSVCGKREEITNDYSGIDVLDWRTDKRSVMVLCFMWISFRNAMRKIYM